MAKLQFSDFREVTSMIYNVPIFRIFIVDSCILGSAADRDMSRIYRRFEYGDQQKRIAQSNARRSEKTL